MTLPHMGRWCIIETWESFEGYSRTSIRCFFESEEAARERWDGYDAFTQQSREVAFINYGETVDF